MRNATPDLAGYLLDEYDAPRFWENVNFHGGTAHETDPLASATGECWLWTGWFKGKYGQFRVFGKDIPAHRIAVQEYGRKIPAGYDVDHLCRVPACVNPAHLEAVTATENTRRGLVSLINRGVCKHGHEMTPDNVISVNSSGTPHDGCKTCRRASNRATYQRSKRA